MRPPTAIDGHADASYLVLRGRVWQFRRRVPFGLEALDPRGEIRVSTGTRDKTRAALIAARINEALEEYWRNLLGSGATVHDATKRAERFDAAIRTAKEMGLAYRSAPQLAAAGIEDIVARVEMLETKAAPPATKVVTAVLGGAEKPALALSGLFAVFEKLTADRLIGKSANQLRKWRNPRLRAIDNLTNLIGDKALADITRDDALDFRSWWLDRVREEKYDPGSANKDLGYISTMMRVIDMSWRLNLTLPFNGLRIAGEKHNPRIAYDPEFVRARILPGTELSALNPEARGITRLVAATGMRPSEVAALTAARIILDGETPHVQIRPDNRQLKTDQSERDMPLVGIAFAVMKEFPDGFPRYRDAPDNLSAAVNKALSAAGLRPTPDHTLYSLRHTFKDRLIALEAPERIQDALMGHAIREVRYGSGPSLAQRAEWLARVWC